MSTVVLGYTMKITCKAQCTLLDYMKSHPILSIALIYCLYYQSQPTPNSTKDFYISGFSDVFFNESVTHLMLLFTKTTKDISNQ